MFQLYFFAVSEAMKHTNLVKLSPGETAEFELWFEPKNTACYSCAVKLHIVDNPFELFLVWSLAKASKLRNHNFFADRSKRRRIQ